MAEILGVFLRTYISYENNLPYISNKYLYQNAGLQVDAGIFRKAVDVYILCSLTGIQANWLVN